MPANIVAPDYDLFVHACIQHTFLKWNKTFHHITVAVNRLPF